MKKYGTIITKNNNKERITCGWSDAPVLHCAPMSTIDKSIEIRSYYYYSSIFITLKMMKKTIDSQQMPSIKNDQIIWLAKT